MKRGGSKMGYTAQFNLLSPCYKEGEQRASDFRIGGAKATKKGKTKKLSTTKKVKKAKSSKKQRGGSSCGASPSVAEMGVVDRPASLQATASELAWDNRMKGGANAVAPPPTGNLLSSNSINTTNKTTSVNSGNSPLNKIKNELLPEGTDSGLAMKLIKTSKNSTNPTYSFEIFYKSEGNKEIQKSSKSNVKFGDFLSEYREISTKVFPPPSKTNGKVNAVEAVKPNGNKNSTVAAVVKANETTVPAPDQVPELPLLGGRKRKNNRK